MKTKYELEVEIFNRQKKVILYIQTVESAISSSKETDLDIAVKYLVKEFYRLNSMVGEFYRSYGIDLDSGIKDKFHETIDKLEKRYGTVQETQI